jgi:hypothetical protein
MDNVVSHIANYADIDTRRAMGFPPRKINSEWKDFNPHPYGREVFKYLVDKQTLLYYEFWSYGQFYSEITKRIVPEDPIEHRWRYLYGSKIYGLHYNDSIIERYKTNKIPYHFETVLTVGWPTFIV